MRRLVMPPFALAFFVAPLFAQAPSSDISPSDLSEMEHCHLTLDNLKRFYAAAANLASVARTDPRLSRKLDEEPTSIPVTTRRLQSEPAFVATLTAHGFTPHQFTVIQFAVLQTVVALLAKEGGATPAELAGVHVAPGNLTLFEQHGPEIDRMQHPQPAKQP